MVKRASDSHIVVRKGVAEALRSPQIPPFWDRMAKVYRVEAGGRTHVSQAIAFLLSDTLVTDAPTGMQRKALNH